MKDIVKSQANDEYKVINGRKVRVQRRKRRSNLMTYCALAVAFFTTLGLVISLCFLFDLEQVEVSGLSLYSNEQVIAAGGVESGANLIRANTSVIEKRLTDTLPYIKSVSVTKKYPHSMSISIVEESKCCDIEHGGRYCVVAESGKILEADNYEHDPTLPLVTGFQLKDTEPDEDDPDREVKKELLMTELESEDELKAKVLMQLIDAIHSSGLRNVTGIDITERTDIVLKYDDRVELRVGSSYDLEYKLLCLKRVLEDKISDTFDGVLIYNGAISGVSALPKDAAAKLKGAGGSLSAQTDIPQQTETVTQPAEAQTEETPALPEQTTALPEQTTAAEGYTGWQT